jgi:DNA mismatch repair protein MSH5
LNRGTECPKVLVATHFHDVFDEEILDPDSIPVSFYHMQVMFISKTGDIVDPNASSEHSPGASVAFPSTPAERESIVNSRPEKITYLYR